MEERFYGYFLLRNQPLHCVDQDLPLNFALPSLQWNQSYSGYVRGTGNSMILPIICVQHLSDKDYLLKFAEDLQHLRKRRILAIYNRNFTTNALSAIETFFQYCQQVKFVNVILVHRDFANTHIYHSYNQFPEFELETRDMRNSTSIYPNRLADVAKTKLNILVDQVEPNTMFYVSKSGALYIAGYIGHFIAKFAERYNFQLWLPDNYNSTTEHAVYAEEIRQAARNGSIEVGASLLTPLKEMNVHGYVYPIEFFQWLTMMPVEPPLETYQFFILFFRPAVLVGLFFVIWLLCFVNAVQIKLVCRGIHWNRTAILLLIIPWELNLLRGLLCQSTAIRAKCLSRRILFILIFLLGGMLGNFFSTNLVKWLTVPPHEEPIESFREAAKRNVKIQLAEPAISDVKFYRGEDFWKENSDAFHIVKTIDEYQANMRKMDIRYGYVIESLAWPIIEHRQRYFTHPLFRLSENLYYTKGSLLSLPISENCIYKDLLSDFYLRSRESGLLSHWYDITFFLMVRLGRFTLKDLSIVKKHEILTLKEFEWVWLAYGVGMGFSLLTFLFELHWHHFFGGV
ncbi:uncharacterized protein LOC126752430 [Bactrocera neohumeralis]|uniref:uncharacterized protein LOC126752430 n=1 Tax=Bactrocera neohumeralis TaxID=98809 RepID=UPI0021654DD5|nr:uncharacterized protein LOC126752430 [Bactrocera neohumeralis]